MGILPERDLFRLRVDRLAMETDVIDAAIFQDTAQLEITIAAPDERDRRVAPRFCCDGAAEVIVLGGALRFRGLVRNLSATGCCLSTDVVFSLERGTQVEIVMVVNDVQFRVAGGVRSNHKVRGVGIEFMNVSSRCARLVQELIAELAAKARRAANQAKTPLETAGQPM
jgi:hypothetical protein